MEAAATRHADKIKTSSVNQKGRRATLTVEGSKATVYRWAATRQQGSSTAAPNVQWPLPSRRNCAWLLSNEPTSLDEQAERLLHHLYENAPQLANAGELARRLAALIRGDDNSGLEQWREDASSSEPASLAWAATLQLSAQPSPNPGASAPSKGRSTFSRRSSARCMGVQDMHCSETGCWQPPDNSTR
ncbi:hypothetical protein ACVWYH_005353 [Bradyrhizobium sp. GM24.11]